MNTFVKAAAWVELGSERSARSAVLQPPARTAEEPKFVESAPPEVVEETRKNLAQREAEESKLREALTRLLELE